MGDKGNKDKGKRQQEKAQCALKEKRKQKREKKGESYKGGAMAMFTSSCSSGKSGEDSAARMAEMFGPGHIDQMIRQGINFCWMALPKDRRTADEVEKQIRRMVDRALKDFREDQEQFSGPT